jgi:hypothetical protein
VTAITSSFGRDLHDVCSGEDTRCLEGLHETQCAYLNVDDATFAAVTFSLCVAYGLIVPPAYHATQLLEMTLPGFVWISFGAFCLGLMETFLYGAYIGLAWALIHNFVLSSFSAKGTKPGTHKAAA